MKSLRSWLLLGVLVAGAALTMPLLAQQPGGGAGGAGGAGGRGGFDPAAMRQRMMDRIKEQLGAKDDEWKLIQPKVEKVTTLQRDTRGGGGFGRPGRGGPPGGGGGAAPADAAPLSDVAQKAKDLQTVLDNKDAKPEEIKAKLTALREARTKAAEDLKKARAELTELLTQRQEAVLVEMGILE